MLVDKPSSYADGPKKYAARAVDVRSSWPNLKRREMFVIY